MSELEPKSEQQVSREEWQADVRRRLPFQEDGNPVQEPYGITTYPVHSVGINALHNLMHKTPSQNDGKALTPGSIEQRLFSWANFSAENQLGKMLPALPGNEDYGEALNNLLGTSEWRRELVGGDSSSAQSLPGGGAKSF